jgi:hypothetical protein
MFQTEVAETSKHFYFRYRYPEHRDVYEIMWKKNGKAGEATDDIVIRSMRFASWMSKATNTHSEWVILITFPRRQWLHGRALLLRYTDMACLCRLVFTMTVLRTTCSAVNCFNYQLDAQFLYSVIYVLH